MRIVKAAVYYETGPPDVFRYEDVPDPGLPARLRAHRVEAISIEGGDTLHRAGGELTVDTAHRRLPVRGHDPRGRRRT